jgi:hypothetical protein
LGQRQEALEPLTLAGADAPIASLFVPGRSGWRAAQRHVERRRTEHVMKGLFLTFVVWTMSTLCFGRPIAAWTYQELFKQADLVVVAAPISTQDTKESRGLPGWTVLAAVGVNTEFHTSLVMKGDKKLKRFILHHYRLKDPEEITRNAPALVKSVRLPKSRMSQSSW